MINAAIYCRVSTSGQQDNESLEKQRVGALNYVAAHGWECKPEHVFTEVASASNSRRPGLQTIIRMMIKKEIRVLAVWSSDRLTREGEALTQEIRQMCRAYGVELHFPGMGGKQNLDEAFDIMAGQQAIMDKAWGVAIVKTMREGKQRKMDRGVIVGSGHAPYGYRKDGRKHLRFVIDEEYAPIVRRIFHWYVNGNVGTNEIVRRLVAENISPPSAAGDAARQRTIEDKVASGGDAPEFRPRNKRNVWHKISVYDILKNEIYTGTYYQNKHKTIRYNKFEREIMIERGEKPVWKRVIIRPREEWKAVAVPPIIDQETFQAAQHRLSEGKKNAPRRHAIHFYLMARRIQCACGAGRCGSFLRNKNRELREYSYYSCNRSRGGLPTKCKLPMVRSNRVDDVVWRFVRELLLDPDNLKAEYHRQLTVTIDEQQEIIARRDVIITLHKKTEQQIDGLLRKRDAAEDAGDEIETAHYAQRINEAKQTLRQQRADIAEIDRRITTLHQPTALFEGIEAMAATWRNVLDDADDATKREIVEALDIRATVGFEDGEHWCEARLGDITSMREVLEESPISVGSQLFQYFRRYAL